MCIDMCTYTSQFVRRKKNSTIRARRATGGVHIKEHTHTNNKTELKYVKFKNRKWKNGKSPYSCKARGR